MKNNELFDDFRDDEVFKSECIRYKRICRLKSIAFLLTFVTLTSCGMNQSNKSTLRNSESVRRTQEYLSNENSKLEDYLLNNDNLTSGVYEDNGKYYSVSICNHIFNGENYSYIPYNGYYLCGKYMVKEISHEEINENIEIVRLNSDLSLALK